SGAGTIGTNLTLVNQGRIIGDGSAAALTVNTGGRHIANSGLMEGTTAKGMVVASNVTNTGALDAFGTDARLVLDGTVTNNGRGSVLEIDGTVGALSGTIGGGLMEFKGASAANVSFAAGQVGTLKLDSSFTGTVFGFGGNQPLTFSNFFAFGDSTVDSG